MTNTPLLYFVYFLSLEFIFTDVPLVLQLLGKSKNIKYIFCPHIYFRTRKRLNLRTQNIIILFIIIIILYSYFFSAEKYQRIFAGWK